MTPFRPPALSAFAAILALAAAGPASAARYVVTKTTDTLDGRCDEDCSLREAVEAANLHPGPDSVVLEAVEYALTRGGEGADEDGNAEGDLDIRDELILRGAGAGSSIDGRDRTRLVEVMAQVPAELRNLQLRRGFDAERGGAIDNAGALELQAVRLRGSRVVAGALAGLGGAIHNAGSLVVRRSLIADNHVTNSSFELRVQGGAVYGAPGSTTQIDDSTVRDNSAVGSSDQGWGGGVVSHGHLASQRSLYTGNVSTEFQGSAILSLGTAVLRNVTVSGNGHERAGAAVANGRVDQALEAQMTLRNVTITDNSGGGLYNAGGVNLFNSLVGGNWRESDGERYYDLGRLNCHHAETGRVIRQGGMLVGDNGNCSGELVVDNASVPATIVLPLADYGGPTLTHALRGGAPAIDGGTADSCQPTDQRGEPRPADGDGDGVAACDIGAYERQP